jgi:hypothetical protein
MRRVRGMVTVEFALTLPVFLGALFIVVEAARALYIVNTMAEVSRRVARMAAVTDFNQATTLQQIRTRALFDKSDLPYGAPININHIQLSYLAADGATAVATPACPEVNRAACIADPNGSSCIRFVRVRFCQPGGGATCDPVEYQPLFDVGTLFKGIPLPRFESITPVESLGYVPGATSTCT